MAADQLILKITRLDRSFYNLENNLGEAMFSSDWKEYRLMLEDIDEGLKND